MVVTIPTEVVLLAPMVVIFGEWDGVWEKQDTRYDVTIHDPIYSDT